MTRPIDEEDILQRMAVGETFAEIRREHGYTQRELAKELGNSQAQVVRFEKGQQDFKFSTLQYWAYFFGYELEIKLVPREEDDGSGSGDTAIDESDRGSHEGCGEDD